MVAPGTPKVGAFVLETLTTGMYTDPLDCLREYIQNSSDAILKAARDKVLRDVDHGRIIVEIDAAARTLRVRDNGVGVEEKSVAAKLLNVGMSDKNVHEDAGFRGIGRLAGIAYCDTLVFRTQASGESSVSTLSINAEQLRKFLRPTAGRVQELTTVLGHACAITKEKSRDGLSFFEVELRGIIPSAESFLDWATVELYLAQVAPVAIDSQRFGFGPKIRAWAKKRGLEVPEISTVLKTKEFSREITKSYKRITYETTPQKLPIAIKDVRFFPEDASGESPFWLWYGECDFPGTVSDPTVAGLRLRKKNIAVGGAERMAEVFAEVAESNKRFNNWLIGEVHINDDAVIPNARRDGFEPGEEWLAIRAQLIEFAKARSKDIRECSDFRNASLEKVARPAKKAVGEVTERVAGGVASKDEKRALAEELEKHKERVEKALKGERTEAEKERLEGVKSEINEAKEKLEKAPFVGERLKSSLDRRQRKVLAAVLELLRGLLDKETYLRVEEAIMERFGRNGDEQHPPG